MTSTASTCDDLPAESLRFWQRPLGLYLRRAEQLRRERQAARVRAAWWLGELAAYALVLWGVS